MGQSRISKDKPSMWSATFGQKNWQHNEIKTNSSTDGFEKIGSIFYTIVCILLSIEEGDIKLS